MTTLSTSFKVNFFNTSLSETPKERVQEIIGGIFWKEGAPENWASFDGEVEIFQLQDQGGDHVRIEATDFWAEILINKFKGIGNVRSVKIKLTADNFKSVGYASIDRLEDFMIGDYIPVARKIDLTSV